MVLSFFWPRIKHSVSAKPLAPVVSVFVVLCSLLLCSSPLPIHAPLFLKFCIYILLRCGSRQPILLHCNLEEETPFPPAPLHSPGSGGLSRLIYNAAGVGQIFTLTLCARVCPACREERERERKRQNIGDRSTADSEGEKEGELEGCKCWWAERRRQSSFTHPSSQAPQYLLFFFF